ncbi:disease resistance protein RPP13-like [Pistacia vera]|uniref:disease resistance protein RPP13-like n=1 Tax=Pistacia vera TaxID=55513 RepID=UPI001262F64B|nr:disease resistance protein RPP13-like [Pistacia vera]
MVDAVVSFVIERLSDYLIEQAVSLGSGHEVCLGSGVREVESLKRDLQWMVCFIKDAEDKQVENPLIRQWVSDIRDIAYVSEDVLDRYMASNRRQNGLLTTCSSMFDRYSMRREIEAIKHRLSDISRRCELFGLRRIDKVSEGGSHALCRLKQLRRTTSFERNEINVVGFEDDIRKLLAKLLENRPQRYLISIFGTGGLGKTTLARKLYHNIKVRNRFYHRAWVYVSQDYKTRDLLLRIIKSFNMEGTPELEKMSEEDMERYLHKSLQGCSYLLVIDDIWQKEAWMSLRRAFPDNKKGSRVIITTRIRDVAENLDEITFVHPLRFLTPSESWQLFCEKAFHHINDEGLEKLGREMVLKCGGLPLAIVVLGGLLSTKKPQEWLQVRNHIWRDLKNGSIEISHLLALSFHDLPYQLKLCFLYLGNFPEDSEIRIKRLIRLWVAEGFIPQNEDIMEEVAMNNLLKLINRSLIQIAEISTGKIVTCRVHDLLRDLAIEKAKELNFIHIYDRSENSVSSSAISSSRRQAVYSGNWERCLWLQQSNSILRSLLFFIVHGELSAITKELTTICTKYTLLRVLDLENWRIGGSNSSSLPKEIEKLIHLKYLGLRNTAIHHLPPSIVNLIRLQTLDLRMSTTPENRHTQLPTEICKLKELRHLTGTFSGHLQVDNLTKLQTLKSVEGDLWTRINPEKLVNLRELSISNFYAEQRVFTFDSIAKLKSLRSLSVILARPVTPSKICFFGSLQPLSQCQHLQELSLNGRMESDLPRNLHELLPNLECLSLRSSYLKNDPMPTLEKLQNLMILQLGFSSCFVKKMICRENGFPRLETMILLVGALEEWQVEAGALPVLRALSVGKNSKLLVERLRSIRLPSQADFDRVNFI